MCKLTGLTTLQILKKNTEVIVMTCTVMPLACCSDNAASLCEKGYRLSCPPTSPETLLLATEEAGVLNSSQSVSAPSTVCLQTSGTRTQDLRRTCVSSSLSSSDCVAGAVTFALWLVFCVRELMVCLSCCSAPCCHWLNTCSRLTDTCTGTGGKHLTSSYTCPGTGRECVCVCVPEVNSHHPPLCQIPDPSAERWSPPPHTAAGQLITHTHTHHH